MRNVPPEMKKIFEDLDKSLKSAGAKKLTKKEAQFVLDTLLQSNAMGSVSKGMDNGNREGR